MMKNTEKRRPAPSRLWIKSPSHPQIWRSTLAIGSEPMSYGWQRRKAWHWGSAAGSGNETLDRLAELVAPRAQWSQSIGGYRSGNQSPKKTWGTGFSQLQEVLDRRHAERAPELFEAITSRSPCRGVRGVRLPTLA